MTTRFAYQGVAGAFGEEAAIAVAGSGAELVACPRFSSVFDAVVSGSAARGVVPIENTLAGAVHEVYDLLGTRSDVTIVGESVLRIAHALIAPPGVELEAVRRVFSHPVALAQCESLFRAHPDWQPIAAFNTAGAVQEVLARAEGDAAAIASRRAADRYGGVVLRDGVEDHPQNFTRFLTIAARTAVRDAGVGMHKTSLVLTLEHRPGTLARVLSTFAARGIDLSKIESRPMHGKPFEYLFYVDVAGDAQVEPLASALSEVRSEVASLRVLGSYVAAAAP
ncbi:MAG: prephenate dehydratase [Polyangiales bacterium]